ncbi:hypothetical protein WP50_26825 [Lactiplantibacillus plantarum]|nr:hypothetical protein WP50_26825 [Lactiplantibacillus plantarum]
MAVLVLGGAGYIGSHAVDRLVAKGYDVAVVDNLVTGHRAAVNEHARFYLCNFERSFLMQANLQWLDDPEVFRVNQLPAHSDHHYYHDTSEFKTGLSYERSLTSNVTITASGILAEYIRTVVSVRGAYTPYVPIVIAHGKTWPPL